MGNWSRLHILKVRVNSAQNHSDELVTWSNELVTWTDKLVTCSDELGRRSDELRRGVKHCSANGKLLERVIDIVDVVSTNLRGRPAFRWPGDESTFPCAATTAFA